jgi:hypothetical protein
MLQAEPDKIRMVEVEPSPNGALKSILTFSLGHDTDQQSRQQKN